MKIVSYKIGVIHQFFSFFKSGLQCVCVEVVLLNSQEVQQCEVGLLVEAQHTLPVGGILALLVQGVESKEGGVKTGEQDGQQEGRAADHSAVEVWTLFSVNIQNISSSRSTALRGPLVVITMVWVPPAAFGCPPR